MKDPCFGHDLINPLDDPNCWHGAEWNNQVTQPVMGGDLGKKISVVNDDNTHRVQTVNPIHLPEIDSTCEADSRSKCEIKTITVSENIYGNLDKLDTGYYPIAASEMKVKISSRQAIQ